MAIWTPSTATKPVAKKIKIEGCRHSYSVEVPEARIQDEAQNVLLRIQLQARIPGFRQGKAPLDMVKRQYGDRAKADAVEETIRKVIPELLTELELRAVAAPEVDKLQAKPGSPLKFEMHVEVAPKVEPAGYKGLALSKKEYKVEEKDIEVRLKQLQEGNARLEKAAEEALGKDHYAVVDFELYQDGKIIDGGIGKQELIDMSSDQSIDGLTKGLMGATRGESREFEVKINGKETQSKMTVSEIKNKITPALDDEFAKDLGCESLDDLKAKLRELVVKENEAKSEREVQQDLEKALLEANKFDIPPSLAEEQLEAMLERLLGRVGRPKDQMAQKELDDLRKRLQPEAENSVRMQFLISSIGRLEKIEATDEDVKKDLERQLERANSDKEKKETREVFAKRDADVRALIRERKVFEFLRESAKIKSVKA